MASVLLQADGRFVYQADAGYQGSDQFVVQVDDGRGGVATSTVFIDVGTLSPQLSDKQPNALAAGAPASEPGMAPLDLGQGVFAWTLAEPAPTSGFEAPGQVAGAGLDMLAPAAIHAPLDLRDLLPGLAEELMLPGSPASGSAPGVHLPPLPTAQVLDLHLDLAMGGAWHRPGIDPWREHPPHPTD